MNLPWFFGPSAQGRGLSSAVLFGAWLCAEKKKGTFFFFSVWYCNKPMVKNTLAMPYYYPDHKLLQIIDVLDVEKMTRTTKE